MHSSSTFSTSGLHLSLKLTFSIWSIFVGFVVLLIESFEFTSTSMCWTKQGSSGKGQNLHNESGLFKVHLLARYFTANQDSCGKIWIHLRSARIFKINRDCSGKIFEFTSARQQFARLIGSVLERLGSLWKVVLVSHFLGSFATVDQLVMILNPIYLVSVFFDSSEGAYDCPPD